ncbi:MAG: T9SS type A sorting domain-containing protein [Firmicutes bacterium]|nr:T9SS type A sorting domain-containing protein [Bacillota bacterium]MCM1401972.1 T9SS type A sorting domain-containing protein [Bacteroides sp.]MCM1477907.1 T9SS type A sorting domain-containing protein [Bacteroides sp.]
MMKKKIGILLLLAAAFQAPVAMWAEPAPQQWVANQADAPKVTVGQGSLTITSSADVEKVFEVYSITGQLVKRIKLSNGSATIDLHRGCYIVKCEKWSKKVVVN